MGDNAKTGNGLAKWGFILSLLAVIISVIGCVAGGLTFLLSFLNWILIVPGLGLSIAGLCVKRPKKGLAIAGIILALLAAYLPFSGLL